MIRCTLWLVLIAGLGAAGLAADQQKPRDPPLPAPAPLIAIDGGYSATVNGQFNGQCLISRMPAGPYRLVWVSPAGGVSIGLGVREGDKLTVAVSPGPILAVYKIEAGPRLAGTWTGGGHPENEILNALQKGEK